MKKQCNNVAEYRYTWPGKDESFVCFCHVGKLRAISESMGIYLQLVRIIANHDEPFISQRCQQVIDD